MTTPDRRVTADEARRNFREVLNEVEHDNEHVTIMRYGQPAAVLVPVPWHDAAAEAADALAVHQALSDSLREARRAAGLPARRQPEDHRVVNHIDGDPYNNDPANLEIIDPRKNQ